MNKILVSLSFFICLSAFSCIYFAKNYDPSLFEEKEREVFMFHDGKNANMIVKSAYSGKLPPDLTWVLPLPSKPLFYKEVDNKIFIELRKVFADIETMGGGMSKGISRSMTRSMPQPKIHVHSDVLLSNYVITPIEILSDKGGAELNQFLESKGFIGMPENIQRPYLKKGAYFLAINMKPKMSKDGSVSIKPLWISYQSNELKYPLKFTHDYRTFDITLYFYTLPDAMYVFEGAERAATPWGGTSFSRLGDAHKDYPFLFEFLQPIKKSILLNKTQYKKYFDLTQKTMRSRHSGVNFIDIEYENWIQELNLYRMPFVGVNKNFKTKDIKSDPGLNLWLQ